MDFPDRPSFFPIFRIPKINIFLPTVPILKFHETHIFFGLIVGTATTLVLVQPRKWFQQDRKMLTVIQSIKLYTSGYLL